MTHNELQDRAATIAQIIATTAVDDRHFLYAYIGVKLRARGQNFSATLFEGMARRDSAADAPNIGPSA